MSSRSSASKTVLVVGTSHHMAELDVRERLHMSRERAANLARTLAEPDGEAVVLSTCNRTELYLVDTDRVGAVERARRELAVLSRLPEAELERVLYTWEDGEAALHLFRVTAGLDSLVRGESQIIGQVRHAYVAAQAAGATGLILNRLFSQALRVGKRLRSAILIGGLASSVPAAAAELAERSIGGLDGRRILVIGAGKMGKLAAANVVGRGAERVFVANHTMGRAEELARRFGGEAVPFDRLPDELERADVVISSTGCPQVILTAEQVTPALRRREQHPLVFIDIAVPRDLDPAIGRLDGCRLYDIDDLGDPVSESLAERREEILAAEETLREEVASWRQWRRSLDAVPAITALRRRAEEIRLGELARSESRLHGLSAREREAVDLVTTQIVNNLLHPPTVRIKHAADEPETPAYIDALLHLFALDEREG